MLTSVQISTHIFAQGTLVSFDARTRRATVSLGADRTVTGHLVSTLVSAQDQTPRDARAIAV